MYILNGLLKVLMPNLTQLMTFKANNLKFSPNCNTFYRNIIRDGNVQYEYYRFKSTPDPIAVTVLEMYDDHKLVAVVISVRYDVAAQLEGETKVVLKLDLLDISISNEPALKDTPEWRCGTDLFPYIQYSQSPESDIFKKIFEIIEQSGSF